MSPSGRTQRSPHPDTWCLTTELAELTPPESRRKWRQVPYEKRFRQQRSALLRSAAHLAGESGYTQTSVKDIAAHAGVGKRIFYEHFQSKEECFVELSRRINASMLRVAGEALEEAGDDPFETLRSVLRAIFEYISQDPRLAASPRWSSADSPAMMARREANHDHTVAFFVDLAKRFGSPLPPDAVSVVSDVLVSGVSSMLAQLLKQDEVELRAPVLAELFCSGLQLKRRRRRTSGRSRRSAV